MHISYSRRSKSSRLAGKIGYVASLMTPEEQALRLDQEARRCFGMSGDEFRTRYLAGQIPEPDRTEVIRVAMLLGPADPAQHRSERGWWRPRLTHPGRSHGGT